MRSRLIGKKDFASQFKDGGEGKTGLASFELKEKYDFAVQCTEAAGVKPSRLDWIELGRSAPRFGAKRWQG
jgi:hypothetical protein